jgi:hypothetical protein
MRTGKEGVVLTTTRRNVSPTRPNKKRLRLSSWRLEARDTFHVVIQSALEVDA